MIEVVVDCCDSAMRVLAQPGPGSEERGGVLGGAC